MSAHAATPESLQETEGNEMENPVEEIFSGITKIAKGIWKAVRAVLYDGPKAGWEAFKKAFKGETPAAHAKTADHHEPAGHGDAHHAAGAEHGHGEEKPHDDHGGHDKKEDHDHDDHSKKDEHDGAHH